MKKKIQQPKPHAKLTRFLKIFAVSGMVAASAVCPCCGKPACPVGMSIASSIGVFLIPLKVVWVRVGNYFRISKNVKSDCG